MNDRDFSLDYVKGFLVICMVIYHTLSYFTTIGYDGIKYVRFVTGSFIFISGYIVAVFYQKKFYIDKIQTSKRLILRGLKLLLIFTSFNIIINLLNIQSHKLIQYNLASYLRDLHSIYIDGDSIYAVFQILVPIAYLLLISPFLLFLQNWKNIIIITTSLLLSAYVFFNINSPILYGLLIGLVGLSIGLMAIDRKKYSIKFKSLTVSIFCIIIFLMKYLDRNIISYCLSIMIILKLVYDFSKAQDFTKKYNKVIILLGQYSLISYIMQIFFLQSFYQFFIRQRFDIGYQAFVICIITIIFLILLCLLLDTLRGKFMLLDKAYKLIFS